MNQLRQFEYRVGFRTKTWLQLYTRRDSAFVSLNSIDYYIQVLIRTALGGANTVGVIPQALGGGLCALSHLCVNTSDNILSARLITAAGQLITVDSRGPDLLWAVEGAG